MLEIMKHKNKLDINPEGKVLLLIKAKGCQDTIDNVSNRIPYDREKNIGINTILTFNDSIPAAQRGYRLTETNDGIELVMGFELDIDKYKSIVKEDPIIAYWVSEESLGHDLEISVAAIYLSREEDDDNYYIEYSHYDENDGPLASIYQDIRLYRSVRSLVKHLHRDLDMLPSEILEDWMSNAYPDGVIIDGKPIADIYEMLLPEYDLADIWEDGI